MKSIPNKVYFIITPGGHVESTHLTLKAVSSHLKLFGSFSQGKLKKDLNQGRGRVHYQLPIGLVLLREESLAN